MNAVCASEKSVLGLPRGRKEIQILNAGTLIGVVNSLLGIKAEIREIVMEYIWYAGYGSNLSEQRFQCYIHGGTPRFGRKQNAGCKDKTLPARNKSIIIHYPLYFALPGSSRETSNWGSGGVAFIRYHEDKELETFCRMWKITKEQYEEVRNQEGRSWYGKEIPLGENDGVPCFGST